MTKKVNVNFEGNLSSLLSCDCNVNEPGSSQKKKVLDFWSICEHLSKLPFGKCEEIPENIPLPYRFLTPNRVSVDLRLHDPVLLERCLHVIGDLENSVRGDWFQDFIEYSVSQFRDEKKSVSEVKRLVLLDGMKQYAIRLFDAIRQSEALYEISPGIAEPLIQEAKFKLIVTEAKELFMQNWLSYCQSYERNLKLNNPVLFNIPKWRSKQWYYAKAEYLQEHKLDIHEYVLSKCISNGLESYAFLIGRDLAFLKDRECFLRDQIFKSARFPDEEFIFQVSRRCLRNVYVYREDFSLSNPYQLVDTILVSYDSDKDSPDKLPTIKQHIKRNKTQNCTTEVIPLMYRFPRSSFAMNTSKTNKGDNFSSHGDFFTDNIVASNTDFSNILNSPDHRYRDPLLPPKSSTDHVNYSQSNFVMQSTLVLKASTRHFMWRWLVFFLCTYSWLIRSSQYFFGYVYHDKAYYNHTLISFLRQMWTTLRKNRQNFDHQLLSTGIFRWYIIRPIHWIWTYIICGVLTTMVLIIFWPTLCILCSTTSIVVGVLSIPVIPLLSLLAHLLGLLFWNAYTPVTRIPCQENCSVKRSNDPKTVRSICLLARPEDILIILNVQLEYLELNLWKSQMESMAKKPITVYKKEKMHILKLHQKHVTCNHLDHNLTLDLGSELTKCFYELRILPRIHLLERRIDDWWSEFQLDENDFTGLCSYLLRNAFGEQIFSCITEKNITIPLQTRDASLGHRFRELILSNLSKQICGSSAHSVHGNEVQSVTVESVNHLEEESCDLIELDNEDESLSLGSDSCASKRERLSQRCTVIAVSSKQEHNDNNISNCNNVVSSSNFPVDSHNSVTETSCDPNSVYVSPIVHSTVHSGGYEPNLMKPSIIDPMSLIHIDLPNFPLSVFAPRTVRTLPSPLKSCSRQNVPSVEKSTRNHNTSSQCSCISLTKTYLESDFHKYLAETWSDQSFDELNSLESDPLMQHKGAMQSHHHKYSAAKRLLSSWTILTSGDNVTNVDDISTNTCDKDENQELHDKIRSLLRLGNEENQWCYCCDHLSTRNSATMSNIDKSIFAFQNVIQHMARVYHPCIITLLMHSRDRENTVLDVNHPLIHKLIHQITRPKAQMKLIKKIHAHENIVVSDLTGYLDSSSHKSDGQYGCLRRNDGSNMNSMSLDTMNNASNDILPYFKQPKHSQQFLKSPISTSGLIHHPDSTAHYRWYSNVNVSFTNPHFTNISNNDCINNVMNQSLHFQPNWSKNHSSHEGIYDFAHSQQYFIPMNEMAKKSNNNYDNQITVINDNNLLNAYSYRNSKCFWSGLEIPTNNHEDKDFSGGTPTPSLYGTEDAATTDDLDETEDILSMSSSVHHSELVDNLLNITTQEQDIINDISNPTATRPLRLPLAIPELLTISATTAGSGDTQSQLESEIIDDCSSFGLTSSRLSNPRQSLSFTIDPLPCIQSVQSKSIQLESHEVLKIPATECACSPVGNSNMFFDSSPAETVIINGMFGTSKSSSHLLLQDQDIQSIEENNSNFSSNIYYDNNEQHDTKDISQIESDSTVLNDQIKIFEMDNVDDEECVDDEHNTLKTVIELF
ncbi:solute carrier family 13 (sodium-dependent dicarboxylate transporter), member 2/3/5 [Schistosoma bovis]|uniref:Solute carrier family 13 (Sodium-dependent dicarboxylate transporter), member 2/3/5 n=1 Tax=Schistosoma bovis TaxID=6184 RepID=A0A430QPR8_SCHBO|nr:solute carrier family 13 (sodium-dependent dicarboxylate transporter), member 2/3/5 [Schistosoma bovis]